MRSSIIADRVLVGKPEGKIPHRRHVHKREDNIKMDEMA
jgi:hypothetical protein